MSGYVYALVNQKGGIGKTTSAIHIGVGLKNRGFNTLIIDMDAQCNLTFALGGDYQHSHTVMDAILGKTTVFDCIQHLPEVDIIPGSSNLSTLDNRLPQDNKEFFLENIIRTLKNMYDYIIIDSPPALSLITVGIMVVSDSLIIPAGMDMFSLQGIGQLYRTYSAVKQYCNESLEIEGILVTKASVTFRKYLKETADNMNVKIFASIISQSVILQHAILAQQSIYKFSPNSTSAEEFYRVVDELIENRKNKTNDIANTYNQNSQNIQSNKYSENNLANEDKLNDTYEVVDLNEIDNNDYY